MTRTISVLFLLLPFAATAADDNRVPYVEQEVRNLQRQVMSLSRRIDELERRPALANATPRGSIAPAAATGSEIWIDAEKWRKVRPGMSELEVIGLLGPPTTLREQDGARVLFYALEIGSSGFLGGSVRFRQRAVVEVLTPTLQ
jgi:hypothetical protein